MTNTDLGVGIIFLFFWKNGVFERKTAILGQPHEDDREGRPYRIAPNRKYIFFTGHQ